MHYSLHAFKKPINFEYIGRKSLTTTIKLFNLRHLKRDRFTHKFKPTPQQVTYTKTSINIHQYALIKTKYMIFNTSPT